MYTLVLMSALATTPESAQFNGFFRDLAGGSGCHADSRSDSNTNGCNGNSCSGCCGGGLFHGRIINFFRFFGGRGCCDGSSCHGNSCHGNSCNGRSAAAESGCRGSSCNGSRRDLGLSSGCFGSSCTGMAFAPMAIPNADFAQPFPTNTGYGGCTGGGMPSYPTYPTYPGGGIEQPYSPPNSVPSDDLRTYKPTVVDERERGIVIVRLPDDAKLFAEGKQLSLKSDVRRFVTPGIPSDRDAVYNLRVEYTRDGEVISRTKRVAIRAGETRTVEFTEQSAQSNTVNPPELIAEQPKLGLPMAAASPLPSIPTIPVPSLPKGTPTGSKQPLPPLGGAETGTVVPPPQVLNDRAKITIKLPANATLFVDAKKNNRTDTVREFTTPVLKKGELYTYILKAEWSREGRVETEERKVQFMAGEMHTVDFTLPLHRVAR